MVLLSGAKVGQEFERGKRVKGKYRASNLRD
jgi:hypothetical protein